MYIWSQQDGTFMKDPLADACLDCPAGFFCVNDKSQDPEPCPRGFYCPTKTGFDWQPCPKGTYGDSPGLANMSSKCPFIACYSLPMVPSGYFT